MALVRGQVSFWCFQSIFSTQIRKIFGASRHFTWFFDASREKLPKMYIVADAKENRCSIRYGPNFGQLVSRPKMKTQIQHNN